MRERLWIAILKGDRVYLREIDILFSVSLLVFKGLECEEGEAEKRTPPAVTGCHDPPADGESGCNAPRPSAHSPPFG